jgi:hypothetical protein
MKTNATEPTSQLESSPNRTTNSEESKQGQGGPSSEKRRRSRAPVPVSLHLHPDLKGNDNHPLAGLDPVHRSEQRELLIATVLARLANGSPAPPTVTITEDGVSSSPTAESSKAG